MVWCSLASIAILTLCLVITARLVPGVRFVDGKTALAAGAVLWLLRLSLGKLLMLLCLPLWPLIGCGLVSVAINAVLLRVTGRFVRGFQVQGFGATVLAALCVTVLWRVLSWLVL
jgi:uncharacterized membrane protein YvlD (DUF360 family)